MVLKINETHGWDPLGFRLALGGWRVSRSLKLAPRDGPRGLLARLRLATVRGGGGVYAARRVPTGGTEGTGGFMGGRDGFGWKQTRKVSRLSLSQIRSNITSQYICVNKQWICGVEGRGLAAR